MDRRVDRFLIRMGIVKLDMPQEKVPNLVTEMVHMLDNEEKWAVVEPILRDVEAAGWRPRRGP